MTRVRIINHTYTLGVCVCGNKVRSYFKISQHIIGTILFADDQGLITKAGGLRWALYTYYIIYIKYHLQGNIKISTVKQKSWHLKELSTL